eukprot:m.843344 g.843344  ORF g.843344 m.843344 type:complete len:131 (-) comp59532_c1_seq3:102-494(-)
MHSVPRAGRTAADLAKPHVAMQQILLAAEQRQLARNSKIGQFTKPALHQPRAVLHPETAVGLPHLSEQSSTIHTMPIEEFMGWGPSELSQPPDEVAEDAADQLPRALDVPADDDLEDIPDYEAKRRRLEP